MAYYQEKDGLRYQMEQLYISGKAGQFPASKYNYIDSFKTIEDYMNANCHPNTVIGAALNGDGLLTDHGIDHVKMVIDNAGKLVEGTEFKTLNGYEIFILLLACHFHDVGNVFGRENHEKEIDRIISSLSDVLPLDITEKILVSDIAMSHGGYIDDDHTDKDTLRNLALESSCNGIPVRPALLGAILRFADELSDDWTRTSRYLDKEGVIPPENLIYHAYSKALSPITIEGNVIKLEYYIAYEYQINKIPDNNGEYLYDEIIKRLKKCMQELEYCKKYSEGFIRITKLNVIIYLMRQDIPHRYYKNTPFTLQLSGYPNTFTIPEGTLKFKTGAELSAFVIGRSDGNGC